MMHIEKKSIPSDIYQFLAQKQNGGLFEEISLRFCGRDFVARKDFYTVQNGEVFTFCDGKLYPTNDCLLDVESQCVRIGDYKEGDDHPHKTSSFSYDEIKNLLKL